MQKRIKIKILKIFEALKNNGPLHIRGLAKATEIHPATVSSIVSRLNYFFDVENLEIIPNSGFRAKVVRLKNTNVKIEDVERYLEVKKQIRGV